MKVNSAKSRYLLVSRSHTVLSFQGDLHCEDSVLARSSAFTALGLMFHTKLTFERPIISLISSTWLKLGILRKGYNIFLGASISANCFRCFILLLEYCAPMWSSAAASRLHFLDVVVRTASFLCA